MRQATPDSIQLRRLVTRLVVVGIIVAVAAIALVASAQEVIRTGRPLSAGGPVAIVMAAIIIVAALYISRRVRTYLDETWPPRGAVPCMTCGTQGAAFDRRCRQCGARLQPRT